MKRRVRVALRAIADHLPVCADDVAGLTLRQTHHSLQMRNSIALHGGFY